MFYPLKFKPVFKDYIWGGRNLEQLGKKLPPGIVAESWEISCHPNGVSIVSNGEFSGVPLTELVQKYGRSLLGTALSEKDILKFPLLVKLIDANDKLSVQVHPDDNYAFSHENGELGKNEMWYILSAKPGAKLIYDVLPGTTPVIFAQAVKENRVADCLKFVEVSAGDTVNIPAGLIHAIGEGITLAEIQQNSDTTYRVYDYHRTDKNGNPRPLHIDKAQEVIDFNSEGRPAKVAGLTVKINDHSSIKFLVANSYFAVQLLKVNGTIGQEANGSKFYIYLITDGKAEIKYEAGSLAIKKGESLLIPANLGEYHMEGNFEALRAFVPDLPQDVLNFLKKAGYSENEIYEKVSGLRK